MNSVKTSGLLSSGGQLNVNQLQPLTQLATLTITVQGNRIIIVKITFEMILDNTQPI